MIEVGRWMLLALSLSFGIAGLDVGLRSAAAGDEAPSDRSPTGSSEDADLSERVRRLEEMNRRLLEQYESVLEREKRNEARYQELESKYNELMSRIGPEGRVTAPGPALAPRPAPMMPSIGSPRRPGGVTPRTPSGVPPALAEGPDRPDVEPDRPLPLRGELGEGFELESPDEEFELRFRVLNQVDFKAFAPNDQSPATSGLYLPRTRVYFEGRLTRPFEYEVSVQRSVEGVFDVLDANLDTILAEEFRVRFGRFIVPYSYDWYDHLEPYFITPERGLFPLNFGLSRQAGVMAHGLLDDGTLEYAIGGFDGRLIGLADNNTTRDAVGYLNWRPFLDSERYPALRYLNLGGSIAGGQSVRLSELLPLRTSIQSTENDEAARSASIVFLEFEEGVFGLGDRMQGALHMAYYGGGFSIEAEAQAGRFQYVKAGLPIRPQVPVLGYHVTAAYFLTGEVVRGRTTVVPMRPINPLRGRYGPGAIEAFARISQLRLGPEVFTFELADPEKWTNDASVTDIGFNWYWNRYIKFYFDWQHAFFGSPVEVNDQTGLRRLTSDLFWIRCQVWF